MQGRDDMRKKATRKEKADAGKKQPNAPKKERGGGFLEKTWGNIKAQFLIILSLGLFFATLTWVVFATIVWPAENAEYFRTSLDIDKNRSLEIWGPTIVPGEEPFVEIHFTLHQTNVSNVPLLLSLTIPQEFIVVSPVNDKYAHKVKLNFTGGFRDET